MTVKEVSRQFENVLVDVNHCHGLATVKTKVVAVAKDCVPYVFSASFHV
jgi:hypothetical protein